MRSSATVTPLVAAVMLLAQFTAVAQQSAVTLPNPNATPAQGGLLTRDITVDTEGCGGTYLLGGSKFFTVTVPPANGFPVGCTIHLWNVDPLPVYGTSTFLGTIKDMTLEVLSGIGPTEIGQALAHAGIEFGTTITACPATGCGQVGRYTISNSQQLSAAVFKGTASGVRLSASSVDGSIAVGDAISGSGIPTGTIITGQASGVPGRAGVYITNLPTTASATVTSTPNITFYGTSGGRGKAISGLKTKMLYPGQEITITSLGSAGWAQPLIPPRWQLLPNYGRVRFFISPTGSDTANDGLGGCAAGKPFATLGAAATFIGTQIDFRGDDPVTVQFCPGVYDPATQQVHFPVDIPGRNGGAGLRFTGSPGPLQDCPSNSAVILQADDSVAVFDAELPYVWILIDCMTLNTQGAAVIEANRGSWILLGAGLAIGGSKSGSSEQILAENGSHLVLDNNTMLSVSGSAGSGGAFMMLAAGSQFTNTGGATSGVIWNGGSPADFNYKSVFIAGQGSTLNLGPATFSVNGRMNGYSVLADESWISSQSLIPGMKGAQLSGGACLSGAVNECAKSSSRSTP